MVSLHVEAGAKGAAVLYETLKDAKTAYSDHPDHAPVMYANNKVGITGTFFDWMRQEVSNYFIHVEIHLSHTVLRTLEERCVDGYFYPSNIQQCI